jgi:hypothetical protein
MRLLLFLIFAAQVFGQTTQSIKLKLDLKKETVIEQRVYSLISRELRALHDIDFVDVEYDADFTISIIILEDKNKAGEVIGFSMAQLLTTTPMPIRVFLKEGIEKDKLARMYQKIREDYRQITDFGLSGGSLEDLEKECERIMARWDAKVFDDRRKLLKLIK